MLSGEGQVATFVSRSEDVSLSQVQADLDALALHDWGSGIQVADQLFALWGEQVEQLLVAKSFGEHRLDIEAVSRRRALFGISRTDVLWPDSQNEILAPAASRVLGKLLGKPRRKAQLRVPELKISAILVAGDMARQEIDGWSSKKAGNKAVSWAMI